MRRRWLAIAAAVLAVTAGLAMAAPAHATQQQVCANGGTGYCMQDYGGGDYVGDAVTNYYGSSGYEDFYTQFVNACDGNHYVEAVIDGDPHNCPFTIVAQDQYWRGFGIQQIRYGPGGCVVSGPSSKAVLGTCDDPSNGTGGSAGVLDLIYGQNGFGCDATRGEGWAVNVYNTDYYGSVAFLQDGSGLWAQDYFYLETSGTCWGGV